MRASPPAAKPALQAEAALLRPRPRYRAINDLADPQLEQGAGGGSRPRRTEPTAAAVDGLAAAAAARECILQGSTPKGTGTGPAQAALLAAQQQQAAQHEMPACKAARGAAAVSSKLELGADAALAELGEVLHREGRRLTRGMAHTLGCWGQADAAEATHAAAQAQGVKVQGGQETPKSQAGQGQQGGSKSLTVKLEQGPFKAQAVMVDPRAAKPGHHGRGSAAKAAPAKTAASLKVIAGGRVTKAGGKRSSKGRTGKHPAAAAGAEATAREGRAGFRKKSKSPGLSASGYCIHECRGVMHWANRHFAGVHHSC